MERVGGAQLEPDRARNAIERTVVESWKVPQFWSKKSVDLDRILGRLGPDAGLAVSLSDVIVWACALGLRQHRQLRPERPDDDTVAITYLVAADQGLAAPSLTVTSEMNIEDLAVARREMVGRARAGRLGAKDARPGEFAVSNLGPAGVDSFSALVLPGQRAILAVGSQRTALTLRDGVPVEARKMDLVLSVDHRRVDGTHAAAFLGNLQRTIENFGTST